MLLLRNLPCPRFLYKRYPSNLKVYSAQTDLLSFDTYKETLIVPETEVSGPAQLYSLSVRGTPWANLLSVTHPNPLPLAQPCEIGHATPLGRSKEETDCA